MPYFLCFTFFSLTLGLSRHKEQTYGHGERKGEGEMCGKSNKEISLPYVKEIANGNLLYGS